MFLAVETLLQQAVALAKTFWTVLRAAPFANIGLVTTGFGITEY